MNHEAIALAALKRKRDEHQAYANRLNLAIEALNGGGGSAKAKTGPSAGSLRMKKAWAKRKANAAKAAKAAQVAALRPAEAVAEAQA